MTSPDFAPLDTNGVTPNTLSLLYSTTVLLFISYRLTDQLNGSYPRISRTRGRKGEEEGGYGGEEGGGEREEIKLEFLRNKHKTQTD